jgi:hypothetical protein
LGEEGKLDSLEGKEGKGDADMMLERGMDEEGKDAGGIAD